jgi:hypothetical protein
MIDPLVQFTFNLHENKGAYALLLGSGASRTAGNSECCAAKDLIAPSVFRAR